MSKRKTAAELAANAIDKRRMCWFDHLPKDDQDYVLSVVDELANNADLCVLTVATELAKELVIECVVPRTIETFIKKRISYVTT